MNIILPLILFLVGFEIILRILERRKRLLKFDLRKYPYYRYKANTKGRSPWYVNQIGKTNTPIIEVSELGIRGRFDEKKKNILCLGCSFTEGAGLKDENTYPGKLKELIDSNSYNIVNAGLPGYAIFQIYEVLEDLIKKKPDIIILQTLDFYRYPLSPKEIDRGKIIFQIKEIIKNLSLVGNKLINLITPNKYGHLGGPYFIQNKGLANEEVWKLNIEYLDKIEEVCKERKIKLMMFQWPGQAYFHNQIKNYCKEKGIYHADASEIYSYYGEEELRLHEYDRHPNALANSLIAKAIYLSLKDNNII